MDQQDTPAVLGKFLGLTIPGTANVELHVHKCTVEECEALLNQALDLGLPVVWKEHDRTRWCDIQTGRQTMTLYLPSLFPSKDEFNAERPKLAEPFEIAAPAGVSA